MTIEARQVADICTASADLLDREAEDEADSPERRARKAEAAAAARAYAEQLRAAAQRGAANLAAITAGRMVAHVARMGGWLSVRSIADDDRPTLRALLDARYLTRAGDATPRYELTSPQSAAAAATTREIAGAARIAAGYPGALQALPPGPGAVPERSGPGAAVRSPGPEIG